MKPFIYHNPVKIVFGEGKIGSLKTLIAPDKKILLTYGGGSIKKNGVYDQVVKALEGYTVVEFGGIEPNPDYATCIKAAELCKKEKIDFLLSVGGGSVLDGTKFIAAAALYPEGRDPWELLEEKTRLKTEKALPLGAVLTLPATGSEMNGFSVISRRQTGEKLAFGSPLLYPVFSILDPATTTTLDQRQSANGVVDAFVHVCEQYLTYDVNAPLQERQSEAILKTLLEVGPKVIAEPANVRHRANMMWAATHALNGIIGCGVPQDWATHMIGHELTAIYGLDHAQSLAVVLPSVLRHQKKKKIERVVQYGRRVFHILKDDESTFTDAIEKTVAFFKSLGVKTRLSEYNIDNTNFQEIASRFEKRGLKLGEHGTITPADVIEILEMCI